MSIYYEVQGLYRGEWTTLFAPYATSKDAMAMLADLKERNPACTYRVKWFNKVRADYPPIEEIRA